MAEIRRTEYLYLLAVPHNNLLHANRVLAIRFPREEPDPTTWTKRDREIRKNL